MHQLVNKNFDKPQMFTQQYFIRVLTGQAVFVVNSPGASLAASVSDQSSTENFCTFHTARSKQKSFHDTSTECHIEVINISASLSGYSGFDAQPSIWLSGELRTRWLQGSSLQRGLVEPQTVNVG